LVVRFSEKSPACCVSFSLFALSIPVVVYHFAHRNYTFLMAKKDIFPSDLQSVGISQVYLTPSALRGQKRFALD